MGSVAADRRTQRKRRPLGRRGGGGGRGQGLTLAQAKALTYRTELEHLTRKNADGTPERWRVNGKPKTWKTRPGEVRVPIKRGLYQYGYLDRHNLKNFRLSRY